MTDKPDAPEFGPAMQSLPNDKWRRFVCALFDENAPRSSRGGVGHPGPLNWAIRQAGFGAKTSGSQSVYAQKLLHDKRMRAAIVEYSKSAVRSITPQAIAAVRDLIANPKSKHHMHAVNAVLNRTDPLPQPTTNINIDNTVRVEMSGDAMIARVRELALKHGIDPDGLLAGRRTPEILELQALKGGEEPTP